MTPDEVMAELERRADPQTKKTFLRHGVREPLFGVKIGELKVLQKKIKADHELALALYATGNADAMYLAGLIADAPKMTKAHLNAWAKAATSTMIAGFTVPWVAAESRFGAEVARAWVDSPKELIATAGWSTFASLAGYVPDEHLDLAEIEKLLDRVQAEIGTAKNRVKYAMNGFVIAVGGGVRPLNKKAKAVAKAVGPVAVDMGDTACKVPDAAAYIAKIEAAGKLGAKRKTCRC